MMNQTTNYDGTLEVIIQIRESLAKLTTQVE